MKHYLLIILLLALSVSGNAQHAELSGFVRNLIVMGEGLMEKGASRSHAVNGREAKALTALVRCTDQGVITSNGGRVLASFRNNICIASLPINSLRNLSNHPSILRIEAGEKCSLHTDTARMFANVPPVWDIDALGNITHAPDLPQAYRGKGVVIGVQDIGFDLTHPVFFSRDGKDYIIKRFWDMLDPDTVGSNLYVGREYTSREDILAKAHATDGYFLTHGTHTASIAAGSGYNTPLIGMAPEAELCLVANAVTDDVQFISEEDMYKFTTATDLLGFKYIFDYADSVGKPCVINFSEGSHQDFYDNILYDEVLKELVGPGRIIVASAGNEGHKLTYLAPSKSPRRAPSKSPRGETSLNDEGFTARSLYHNPNSNKALLTFRAGVPSISASPINDSDWENVTLFNIIFDALGDTPTVYKVSPRVAALDSIFCDTLTVGDATYAMQTCFYPNCYDTLQLAGEIYIENLTHKTFGSSQQRVAFEIPATSPSGPQVSPRGDLEGAELFYYIGEFLDNNDYPSDAEGTHNVHFPGASPYVICVGATNSRTGFFNYKGEWQAPYWGELGERSGYSSIGPTHAGLNKPDIYAPGTFLTSAYSSFYLEKNQSSWDTEYFPYNDRTYTWHTDCGTSMSAPVTAGIIALWLQACPTLTMEQALEAATVPAASIATVPVASPAGSISSPRGGREGAPSIDAYAGLLYILDHYASDGIQEVATTPSGSSHNTQPSAIFDLSGRRIMPRSVTPSRGIYIVDGKKVCY